MHDDYMFSVDRLVEFGLSMAVAKQMVDMFNNSMSASSNQQPTELVFYVGIDGKSVGPLNEEQLADLYVEHKITKDSLGWVPGMPSWKQIEQIPSMLKVFAVL